MLAHSAHLAVNAPCRAVAVCSFNIAQMMKCSQLLTFILLTFSKWPVDPMVFSSRSSWWSQRGPSWWSEFELVRDLFLVAVFVMQPEVCSCCRHRCPYIPHVNSVRDVEDRCRSDPRAQECFRRPRTIMFTASTDAKALPVHHFVVSHRRLLLQWWRFSLTSTPPSAQWHPLSTTVWCRTGDGH